MGAHQDQKNSVQPSHRKTLERLFMQHVPFVLSGRVGIHVQCFVQLRSEMDFLCRSLEKRQPKIQVHNQHWHFSISGKNAIYRFTVIRSLAQTLDGVCRLL